MRRRRFLVAALSLGLVLPFGAARSDPAQQAVQAPARDTAPPRTGTARIKGRVLAADTGGPVRRAIVRLSAPDLRDQRSSTTDADGRYDISDLPSGTYYIIASKNGFLVTSCGSARAGFDGKPVKVGDGEVATNVNIILTRGGVIAGRVLDEFGDPLPGASVRVYRSQASGGSRQLMISSSQPTNDLRASASSAATSRASPFR